MGQAAIEKTLIKMWQYENGGSDYKLRDLKPGRAYRLLNFILSNTFIWPING